VKLALLPIIAEEFDSAINSLFDVEFA
jgi:hypothetical protein